jgi:signal transduction histidine kinase
VTEKVPTKKGKKGLVPTFGQIFIECDRAGRILWMSPDALERLGEPASLTAIFPTAPHLGQFLENCRVSETAAAVMDRLPEPPMQVELSCVIRTTRRLLLSIRARQPASSRMEEAGNALDGLPGPMLKDRVSRARRNPAAVISEQLERERARLARELHTGAGQSLSAIKVNLELLENKGLELPADVRVLLDRIAQLTRDAADEVSAVSRRLYPLDWQAIGLVGALRRLWIKSGVPERFQDSLNLPESLPEPPHPIRVALYRIAQEGIANTVRHSGATRLSLSLEQSAQDITLTIQDDGCGFDERWQSETDGIGLRAIRDQVRNLEGDLRITGGAEGTKLEVTFPLEPSDQ